MVGCPARWPMNKTIRSVDCAVLQSLPDIASRVVLKGCMTVARLPLLRAQAYRICRHLPAQEMPALFVGRGGHGVARECSRAAMAARI